MKFKSAILFISIAIAGLLVSYQNFTVDNRLPISKVKSVTLYDQPDTSYKNPLKFEKRLLQAKFLGFNTIWLVVPWFEIEWNVAETAGDPEPDLGSVIVSNLSALRASLALVKKHEMNIMWSVNYLDTSWSPQGLDSVLLTQSPNVEFLLRYTRFVAKLLKEARLEQSSFMLFHDERTFGPYNYLWDYQKIQESYRSYLFTRNSDLAYWNRKWGQHYASWGEIKTHSFNEKGFDNPELQETTGFFNWSNAHSVIGSGYFAKMIKAMAPGIRVGYHYVNFNYLNTKNSDYLNIDSPLGAEHSFDFVSFALYDGEPFHSPFRKEAAEYIAVAQGVFPNLPLFFGEVGSTCNHKIDCIVGSDGGAVASPAQTKRQAQYLSRNLPILLSQNIGFNIWDLHDFKAGDGQAVFGLLTNDGSLKPSGKAVQSLLRFGQPPSFVTKVSTLNAGGVNKSYSPWAIWVKGSGLEAGNVAMFIVNGQVCGDGVPITLSTDKTWFSFQATGDLPFCRNLNSESNVRVMIWNPSVGIYSNILRIPM